MLLFLLPILGAGLVTIHSFAPGSHLFSQQLIWIILSFGVFFTIASFDSRFWKESRSAAWLYLFSVLLLVLVLLLGVKINGARSWFNLGSFTFQPVDFSKITLIIILAKYFSRRHVAIQDPRHIIVSGLYMLVPFILVLLQPDFGSAIILFLIWFGMTLVSGISKKHLFIIMTLGVVAISSMWFFVFEDYQKARIMTFIHPLTDIQGAGYNAYQSTIAVGSGTVLGKGVGYGTQSRLSFLPEYETDFIFAAFAEEWGFVGSVALLLLYLLVIIRIIQSGLVGASNFEMLFALGFAILCISHLLINVGMNIGLLPVTGITLPFMSAGGSHLLALFFGLGILHSMRRYARSAHRDDLRYEFLGI